MDVMRFVGSSVAEAVAEVKRKLGPDAVILGTRNVRGKGVWDAVRRCRLVEITAATPAEAAARLPASPAPVQLASPAPVDTGLRAEMQQVKEMIGCIWRRVDASPDHGPGGADIPMYPENVERVYRSLLESEVEVSLARCIADRLLDTAEGKGSGLIKQEARAAIERLLGPAQPIEIGRGAAGGGRVVAFVGPTGVGKTTTVAKLAAHFALREGKRVALVTIDTFRVGAVDQLREYARIADLPCYVATSPPELGAILKRLSDHDLILVDTAGRSHRDEPRMAELKGFWSERRPDEIHLVVSATSRYADVLDVIHRYREPGFDRLIFTKLDETGRHGLILNVAPGVAAPLSYVTTGQQVPEDIAVARPGDLAKLMV